MSPEYVTLRGPSLMMLLYQLAPAVRQGHITEGEALDRAWLLFEMGWQEAITTAEEEGELFQ